MSNERDQDKVLYENEWVTVKETNDDFVYTEGTDGVAIVPVKKDKDGVKILLRKEFTQLHEDNFLTTIITGRKDEGEDYIETAIRELEEEAGISGISSEQCIDMGDLLLGKDRTIPDRVFIIDVSNGKFGEAEGDGTIYEENSHNFWIDIDEVTKYMLTADDSYLLSGLGKLLALLSISTK